MFNQKEYIKEWKRKNRAKILARRRFLSKQRWKNDPVYREHILKLQKERYVRLMNTDKERLLKSYREYRAKNPEKVKRWNKNYYVNNIHERERQRLKSIRERRTIVGKARDAVNSAVQRGVLIKPLVCSRCPNTGMIHGHHPDYTKPLEVIWLCPICHAKEHAT